MQTALDLRERRVTPDFVRAQRTFTDALRLSIQVSGREQKAIRMDLEIDPGQWSRIMTGNAHFPHDLLLDFMAATGNQIPLEWLAAKRGYGLVLLEDEKDRQIRELREQLDRERVEREAIQKFLRETKP